MERVRDFAGDRSVICGENGLLRVEDLGPATHAAKLGLSRSSQRSLRPCLIFTNPSGMLTKNHSERATSKGRLERGDWR